MRQDLLFALRTLARNRLASGAILLTLALGIGINTAIFSIVHGIVLRPLPYPDPGQLMQVWLTNPRQGIERDITSYPNFADWQAQSKLFATMAGVSTGRAALTGDGPAEEVISAAVTSHYFDVLGVAPLLGRIPTAAEVAPGTAPVVVLAEELWRSRLGEAPDVIGRTIQVNGVTREVVAIMPAGLGAVRVWTPLEQSSSFPQLSSARGALFLPVVGRLRDGVTEAEAQREMSAIALRLEQEYPDVNEGMGVLIEPLRDAMVGDTRSALLLLLGAVGLVLLIACANIANVLLARSAARRREMAVRVAVGARRSRLLRQVLTESLVTAFIGGILGLLVALWSLDMLLAAAPAELPRIDEIRLDAVTLLFTAVVTLVAGLLFGAAPAWQVARRAPGSVLGGSARGEVGSRDAARTALVAAQYALALVLVAGAALLVRSFQALQRVDMGMNVRGVLSFELSPSAQRYGTSEAVRIYYDEVLQRVRALPGVESASLLSSVFMERLPNMGSITLESRALPPEIERLPVAYDAATPGALRTLGMTLLRGRDLADTDVADAPNVAVVNETFVRRFLPDGDPLGQRFSFGAVQSDSDWIRIVGVVADARRSGPAADIRPYIFAPMTQLTPRRMTVLVRTTGEPMNIVPPLRAAVAGVDDTVPIAELRLLQDDFDAALATRRFLMLLIGTFGIAALVLASVGVYGVMAYIVGRRTREIGVRIALGATPGEVQRAVVARGVVQAAAGITIGVVAAVLLADVMRTQVFALSPTDVPTLAGVAALLLVLAAAASWLPARRASRIDPLTALRTE